MSNRDALLHGKTLRVSVACGKMYVTLNNDKQGKPFEIFLRIGKMGSCTGCQMEALGRVITMALQAGVDIKKLAKQLQGLECPSTAIHNGALVKSCAHAVAVALSQICDFKLEEEKK